MNTSLSSSIVAEGGFSMTELMVVLVIIGILALLAMPRFNAITTRAKAAEAKQMLSLLHSLQVSFRLEHDRYADSLPAIGFEQTPVIADGGNARYRIVIEEAGAHAYRATATSTVDFDADGIFNVWAVDETGRIEERIVD